MVVLTLATVYCYFEARKQCQIKNLYIYPKEDWLEIQLAIAKDGDMGLILLFRN